MDETTNSSGSDNIFGIRMDSISFVPTMSQLPTMAPTTRATNHRLFHQHGQSTGAAGSGAPRIVVASMLAILMWVFGFTLFLVLSVKVLRALPWTDRRTDSGDDQTNKNKRNIRSLSLEDWVGLYKKTFDTNGNQLVLSSEHLLDNEFSTNEDLSDADESSSASTQDDIGDTESVKKDNQIIETDDPWRNTSVKSLSGTSKSCIKVTSNDNGSKNSFISVERTCVICMEEYDIGDEIVWSSFSFSTVAEENPASGRCQHFFHKDCMTEYLASNSHRQCSKHNNEALTKGLELETPCPICRRRFCTIADGDLEAAIQSGHLEEKDDEDEDVAANTETPRSATPVVEEDNHDAEIPGPQSSPLTSFDIETPLPPSRSTTATNQ